MILTLAFSSHVVGGSDEQSLSGSACSSVPLLGQCFFASSCVLDVGLVL